MLAARQRTALVTGAARGIGRAIVRRLAAQGHRVVGLDVSADVQKTMEELQAQGHATNFLVADVSDPAQVEAAFTQLAAWYGGVDILVNNAAITNNISATAKMSVQNWQKEIAVNLNGVFYCTKFALPWMVENGWGRIINISSMAASGGLDRQPAYAASKAGILGLTQNVTIEYAEYGITCNAILPGLIATEAVQAMPLSVKDEAIKLTPAKRLGNPEEIAALAAFLASDEAAYINGVGILVDGGAHCNQITLARRKSK